MYLVVSLGCIVISDLVVADLFMHLLSGKILLYLAIPFFTVKVLLHETSSLLQGFMHNSASDFTCMVL